ncbi:cysteine desulfurase [Candidatus Saccharibacteria bacterium]|nr:cysteine desulfurase [Candidatus Saccharibacteria bacterium]
MIYLDFAATSPLLPEARDAMLETMNLSVSGRLGNPSSLHSAGALGRDILESARRSVGTLLHATPQEIIFTSGGTESNNSVLHTFSSSPILVSKIEHPSVLRPAESYGDPCMKIPVDEQGIIDLDFLESTLVSLREKSSRRILVSVMLANNEIGTIEPIEAVSKIIKHFKKVYLHVDATQALGKIPVDVKNLGVDYLTASGHKLGGPVGIGILFVRAGAPFTPLLLGGSQELHRRAGTSNAVLAAGLKAAADFTLNHDVISAYATKVKPLRDYLAKGLLNEEHERGEICSSRASGGYGRPAPWDAARSVSDDGVRCLSPVTTGAKDTVPAEQARPQANCLPHLLTVSFPACEGESTQLYLDLEQIFVSTGSACASGDLTPSHVITALSKTPNDPAQIELAHNSIRFSLGLTTKKSDIDLLLKKLPPIIEKLQNLSTLTKERSPHA